MASIIFHLYHGDVSHNQRVNHVKSSISLFKKVHFKQPASGATEATDGRRIASSTLGRTAAAWRQVFGDDALFQASNLL
jgi:hypothetical protein